MAFKHRRPRGKKVRKAHKKLHRKGFGKKNIIVYRPPRTWHWPWPERFSTMVEFSIDGYILAGGLSAANGNLYYVNANCPFLPMYIDIPSASNQFGGSGSQSSINNAITAATLNAYGFDSFMYNQQTNTTAPYSQCLVKSSSIEFALNPVAIVTSAAPDAAFAASNMDVCEVAIVPQLFNTSQLDVFTNTSAAAIGVIGAANVGTTTIPSLMREMPYGVYKQVNPTSNYKSNILKTKCPMTSLTGRSMKELKSDLIYRTIQGNPLNTSTTLPIAAPQEQYFYTIKIQSPIAISNNVRIPYALKVKYYVDFMAPLGQKLDPLK